MKQHMSGKTVKSVTAATMTSYNDLNETEHGISISAQEMGHGIRPLVMQFDHSRATILLVYCECVDIGYSVKRQFFKISAATERH